MVQLCRRAALPVLVVAALAGAEPVPTDLYGDPLPAGAIARLGTIRQRTTASALALAPGGRTLLTVSGDRTLGRWDPDSGRLLGEKPLADTGTNGSWFSPDGRLLAIREADGLGLWDTEKATRRGLLSVKPNELLHVAISSDHQTLATAEGRANEYRIRLWDTGNIKDRLLTHLSSYTNGLTFDPEGKRLFAAVDNHSLRCWDVATSQEKWQNDHWASNLVCAPDGRTLCTSGYQQGPVSLWDATTGRKLSTIDSEQCWTAQVAFSPDGQTVAQGTNKGVFLWNVKTAKLQHHLEKAGVRVLFAADGRSLFTLGELLERWDTATGKPLYPDSRAHGHVGPVRGVTFLPDGQAVATCGADQTVRLWKCPVGKPRLIRKLEAERAAGLHTILATFTPDGRQFLTNEGAGALALFETESGREVRRFSLPVTKERHVEVVGARLTADGGTLLALGASQDTRITSSIILQQKEPLRGWDMATGREVVKQTLTCGLFGGAEFSPDGRLVVRSQYPELRDVRTPLVRPLRDVQNFFGSPFAFSQDGRLLAVLDRGEELYLARGISVHEVLSGRRVAEVKQALGMCQALAFSPNGRLLAAAGHDALHVWDMATGARLLHMPVRGRLANWNGSRFAECLAFAPDGRTLATGHADGTSLLWDLMPGWTNLGGPDGPLDPAQAWEDLASGEPRTAWKALEQLAAAPAEAVPLLRKRLRAEKLEPGWLASRLADLDSDVYEKREAATRDLQQVVEVVEEDLREAEQKTASAEVRRRLAEILDGPRRPVLSLDVLRTLRGAAVLERIGSKESQALLKVLADGAPGAPLTREAKAALQRLARKQSLLRVDWRLKEREGN
jgi:WD40 repeat protein